MRTRILLMGLLLAAVANAQTIYHDASAFPLLGKAASAGLSAEHLPQAVVGLRPQQCRTRRALPFQLYKHFCQMGSKEQYEYEPHDTDRH